MSVDKNGADWTKGQPHRSPQMATILALPELNTPAWSPKLGDIVENFGQIARVLEIDPERGILVRCMYTGQKWHANPAKVRPVL